MNLVSKYCSIVTAFCCLFTATISFSQVPISKIIIKSKISNPIVSEVHDATISIIIISHAKPGIQYSNPIHFGLSKTDGSDIHFDLYKKSNSGEYKKVVFHTLIDHIIDSTGSTGNLVSKLNYNDSIKLSYNLNLLEFLKKGNYKLKTVFRANYPNTKYYYSEWIFFKVLKDIIPREGSTID